MSADNKIKQAVILSAGLGTRLRSLISDMPKVMAPIQGRPLLHNTIELLKNSGIEEFILNLHYLPDVIKNYFGDGGKFGVNIRYSDETDVLLETAGAIKKMEPWLHDDFLMLYGDQVHKHNFLEDIEAHFANNALATVVLKRSGVPEEGDLAEINPLNKEIVGWVARPHDIKDFGERYYLNAGLYALNKKILDFIPSGKPVKLDIDVLPGLVRNRKRIFGAPTNEKILDIGTPDRYLAADEWYGKSARL